jgi:uncharacterized protein (TIGR02118 family)
MLVLSLHYRRSDEGRFDFEYYEGQHLPLVRRVWGPYIQRIEVLKGIASLDGRSAPPFSVTTLLHFASRKGVEAAFAHPDSALLTQDISNFTDALPDAQLNGVLEF